MTGSLIPRSSTGLFRYPNANQGCSRSPRRRTHGVTHRVGVRRRVRHRDRRVAQPRATARLRPEKVRVAEARMTLSSTGLPCA